MNADDDLSPDEMTLLANALDQPLLAFNPLDDELIVDLLARKLVALRADYDPQHALLDSTALGREAVPRQLRRMHAL